MNTRTKLYIAHSVRSDKLMPAPDSTVNEAVWTDFETFLMDSTSGDGLCSAFLPPLKEWIAKNHHLRGERDFKFGRLLVYNKHRWIGPKPVECLTHLLTESSADPAEFRIFQTENYYGKGKSVPEIERVFFACTCVLPHIELEITPHICYTAEADAQEMAAMAGILYLKEGIDSNSKNFTIAQIDMTETDIQFWNEQLADFITNQVEGAKPGGNLCYWKSSTSGLIPPEQARKFDSQVKTAYMLLSEFCDRKEITLKLDYGLIPQGYVGRVTIPELKYDAFEGAPQNTRKAAKQNVSLLVVESLKTKGLYSP
eukprot:g2225.t1